MNEFKKYLLAENDKLRQENIRLHDMTNIRQATSEAHRMTIQEAIGIMKIALAEVEWEYPTDYAAAFETAIEALEKQIEYRNRIKSLVDTIEYVCKLCDDEHCGLCEYDGAYQGESGD